MAPLPKISIITPSYNHAKFIGQTIESVLSQEYPDLEYLIIDGGSVDGTKEVLERYSGRLKWISEKDRGQSDAINKGIGMATGEIIGMINSDDLLTPGALKKVGAFFLNHPHTEWLTGKCRIINMEGKETRRAITYYKNCWLHLNSLPALLITNYISHPATFIRRGIISRVGSFSLDYSYAMDYDYWLRLFNVSKPAVVYDYLVEYRTYTQSKSGMGFINQFNEQLDIAKKNTSIKILVILHSLHNKMIIYIYKVLRCFQKIK